MFSRNKNFPLSHLKKTLGGSTVLGTKEGGNRTSRKLAPPFNLRLPSALALDNMALGVCHKQ